MNNIKKYNLNYKIEAEGVDGAIYTIQSFSDYGTGKQFKDKLESLAVKINIERTFTNSANKCSISIYNLAENTRKMIKKSRLSTNIYRKLRVYAGYQDFITLIFAGTIQTANSYRENDNFITVIEGRDNYAMINSRTNISIAPNYSGNIVKDLANNLDNIKIGYITEEANIIKSGARGKVINGNTWDIINNANDSLDIFIDNETLFIMKEEEIRTSDNLVIDVESGLLQEPQEYDGYLEVKTLFEPLANINNLITLNSEVIPDYNGDYKLIGIIHNLEIEKIGKQTTGTTTLKLMYNYNNYKRVRI